jgi:hypothetical protein
MISYFVSRIREHIEESEWGGERFLEIIENEFAFTDHTHYQYHLFKPDLKIFTIT